MGGCESSEQADNEGKLTTNFSHNLEAILKDSDSPVDKLFRHHLYDGIYLNHKRKKYWVDKERKNAFFVFARDLTITWAEDSNYWLWPLLHDKREVFVDAAELLQVCWLEVQGEFEMAKLTPNTKYEVVFRLMLLDDAFGWKYPVKFTLVLPDGTTQAHNKHMNENENEKGTWKEILVGEFVTSDRNEEGGCVKFSLSECEKLIWKGGLLVKGVAIRPKL